MTTTWRPNIVVLMADDHRGTEMSHLPHGQARTPVLDALAARGVSFDGAHCQGSMIRAVCVPSRASLMTGRNIFASSSDPTGGDFQCAITIPPDLETFPEALRRAGYRTHAVGKWHNDTASFQRSFSSGDAIMFLGMSDHHEVPTWTYDPDGEYAGANAWNFDEPHTEEDTAGSYVYREGFSSDIFADAAIDFLGQDHGDDPFLMYVAFTAPHDPRTPPPGWEVDPQSIELPPNFLPEHPFDNGEMEVRDELLAEFPRSEAEIRQHIADYYGMIAHLDHTIGRIVGAIEEHGLADDTVIIYTGDHGLALGQHGLMGKQNLYEHSLRVPLVIDGPGVPATGVVHGLSWHADTTATIYALAGLPPNPSAEGASLIDSNGVIAAPRRTLGAAYEYSQRSFRDHRHKLIRYWKVRDTVPNPGTTPGTDMVQLYDLERDPWEMDNLADDPSYAETLERLNHGLQQWQRDVGDVQLAFHPGIGDATGACS